MLSGVTLPLIRDLRRLSPDSKLVLCDQPATLEFVWQAIDLGIRGIIPSNTPAGAFPSALRSIGNGDLWFDRRLTQDLLLTRRVHLTMRESQLVSLMAQGLSNKEIANFLGLGVGTIKVYLSRLFKKVGVSDRFELALYALKNMATSPPVAPAVRPFADDPRPSVASMLPPYHFLLPPNNVPATRLSTGDSRGISGLEPVIRI